ncbi:hypothetical protein [Bellilinea sp.]|uniref:Uncharacterized protein n=1 Tax=Bellilinea caldifistulae TaxID=360411 RepID=A0A7C4Q873_9CHLR|nr:hypothetical protein [Bellilinea sp.]
MLRKKLAQPNVVIILLIIQFFPILLLPPESYSPTTQEWWLPFLLAILALVASIQLVFRGAVQLWPWYLISFAHGFNIISRLMLLMPRASILVDGSVRLNTSYVFLTLLSIFLSALYLLYTDLPEVRISLINRRAASSG